MALSSLVRSGLIWMPGGTNELDSFDRIWVTSLDRFKVARMDDSDFHHIYQDGGNHEQSSHALKIQ